MSIWSKAAFFHPEGHATLIWISENGFNLLTETRNSLLSDLDKISQEDLGYPGSDSSDPSNPFRVSGFQSDTLTKLEEYLTIKNSSCFNLLNFYSEDIFPKLSLSSPHESRCLRKLLSLLFSVSATQVACERLFSTASRTFDPTRSALSSVTLSALVSIQRIFPNTNEGILALLTRSASCVLPSKVFKLILKL